MSRFNFQPLLLVSILFIQILFCFSYCNEKVDYDQCHSSANIDTIWYPTQIDLSQHRSYEGINNEIIKYSFILPTYEDVCPYKHIEVKMSYSITDVLRKNDITVVADVTYGIFNQFPFNKFTLTTEGDIYTYIQREEIGISNVYGDSPGWFFPYFEISFPGLGTPELNDGYFRTNFKHLKFNIYYYVMYAK